MHKVLLFLFLKLIVITLGGNYTYGAINHYKALTSPNDSVIKKDFFSHQKNYIPGEQLNKTVKTIYLAINVWQDDSGGDNFAESDFLHNRMDYVLEHLNNMFKNSPAPSHPVDEVDYMRDSHIRFRLKTLDFYQNSDLNNVGCGAGHQLNAAVFEMEPHKRQYLNIHLVQGNCRGASGYANYPSASHPDADSFIVSFVHRNYPEPERYPFWALMLHIAHELGHNLDLRHPYDSEICNMSHPDFLFDLFGYEKQTDCHNNRAGCDICYHQGGWNCELADPLTTCTNNIMGGNKDAGNITPLQMGRMNRALSLKSVRKYAHGYADEPIRISNDQKWEKNVKLYQDLIIESGATLIITSTLELVPQAAIVVEAGAMLIIDEGVVTNALYSNDFWQGVELKPHKSKGFWFFRSRIPGGKLLLKNGGVIENQLF